MELAVRANFGDIRCRKWSCQCRRQDKTVDYIKNQEAHHRKMTFQEEFQALFKKHRVAYEEHYLWE